MSRNSSDSPWYVDAFSSHYLRVYAHRDERDALRAVDCALSHLPISKDSELLDLCCGAGRHLKLLEEATSNAVGMDLSAPLLNQARASGIKAPIVRADIQRLPFRNAAFDIVLNLFTSFGYFEDDATNQEVAHEVARVLKPGAQVLFDIINPAYTLERLIPESQENRNGMQLAFQRSYDPHRKRVEKHVHITFDDGTPDTSYLESVRLYTDDEFDALLQRAGLKLLKRLGNFDGSDFTSDSPRQIVIAQK